MGGVVRSYVHFLTNCLKPEPEEYSISKPSNESVLNRIFHTFYARLEASALRISQETVWELS